MADMPNSQQQASPPAPEPGGRALTAEEAKEELHSAIESSNQVLVRASTVLTLFPDSMIIDRAKVTITKRTFFRIADVTSMRIEDILNATCTVGPLMGTVQIVSRVMNTSQPAITIGKFWRDDAKHLKRVLQGYVIALQRGIDCSSLGTKELCDMLEELGADNHQGEEGS